MKNKNEKTSSRTFTLWIKTLAYLLSILLILYAVPANIYAELIESVEVAFGNTTDDEIIPEASEEIETEKAVFEVTDRREKTVKHFRTEDGSFTAVQYGIPVHEKDENGKWQDIDNTISDMGNEYGTSNARVKFAKQTTGNETLFTLHDGNRKITMSLSGANKKVEGQVTNTQTEFPENATQLQKLMTLDKLSSRILYPNILDGVDLEYVVNSGNIKENIIVKERSDAYSYTFEIKLNNLVASMCEDGTVAISDSDTDEVVYVIPQGYMFDAEGEYSDAVTYTLTSSGNGKYALTVTADEAWINFEERAFPVTVDPPINVTTSTADMTDTYISELAPNTSYYTSHQLMVGHYTDSTEHIAFWKTSSLPTLPENSYLIKAGFMMNCIEAGHVGIFQSATTVGLYALTSSNWTSGITWNNRSTSFIPNDDDLVDYQNINTTPSGSTVPYQVTWDITSLYTQWLKDPTANHGFALASIGEERFHSIFTSSDGSAAIPRIVIEYRDMKGVESYWSSSSHSAGLAGSGHVNHATGDLVLSVGTFSTTDGLFGYMPSVIYNSAIAEDYYRNSNNPNVYYPWFSTGQGLKLSISESILEGSYIDKDGNDQTYFVWSDSDGTEHYFLSSEYEQINVANKYDRQYKDEDGLRLTLTINTQTVDGYEIIITYSDGSCRVFDAQTCATGIGGGIKYLQDKYGNRLYLAATTDNASQTVIKVLPSGQTEAIEYMTFTYHSMLRQLMEIRDAVSGYVVQFEYGSSFENDATVSATCCGPLRKVKFGHLVDGTVVVDRTASYGYVQCADGLYRLSYAKDDEAQLELRYEYDTLGKVIKISEYAAGVLGQTISYTYGIGYTEVRSSGEDDILQTTSDSDDIITHYTLDKYGRAVSAYSTNAARTAMYGATNNAYEDPTSSEDDTTNENAKNSVKAAAIVNGISANYVYNGSFELVSSVNNKISPDGWLLEGNASVYDASSHYAKGFKGISLWASDTVTQSSITQYVTLPDGTYTLSAKCIADYCSGVVTEMLVVSTSDSSHTYKADIRKSSTDDTNTTSEPVLTFEVNSGSAGCETFAVTFRIAKTDQAASCVGSFKVDQVMLTSNIGAAQYNMVQNGNFDSVAYTTSSSQNLLSDAWQYDSLDEEASWATVKTVDSAFGQSLVITGDVEGYHTYIQTIVPPDSSESDATINRRMFVLSGFGKANAKIANEDAYFCIDVDIYYVDTSSPQSCCFEFNKSISDWQFLSAVFTTKLQKRISHINIICTYASQTGEACFDEISLVEASGNNAVGYDYDNQGRLTMSGTVDQVTYYHYDSDATHNEPTRIIDSQYNLTELTYSDKGVLQSEKVYKYTLKNAADRYDFEKLLETDTDGETYLYITPELQSSTTYTTNTYGLLESTSLTSVEDTPLTLSSRTEYDITAGSRTFGQPLRAVTTSGQVIRYQYNDKGLLLSEFTEGEGGLHYTYDAIGRPTRVLPYLYLGTGDLYYANDIMASASYVYDTANRLWKIVTESTTYEFLYDSFGNPSQIKAGGATLVTYTYAPNNGKLQKMSYGNGDFVEYDYDELDRLSQVCYTDTDNSGNSVKNSYLYTYTSAGELHSVTSTEADRSYYYVRDSEGKIIFYNENDATDGTELLKISCEYDEKNRLVYSTNTMIYATETGTASAWLSVECGYNPDDTLGTYSLWTDDSIRVNMAYTYDGLNRLSTKSISTESFTRLESYTYKLQNDLTTPQVATYTSEVGEDSTTYTYTYDAKGNIRTITEGSNVTEYRYDNLGQLTRENNPYLGKTYTYTYDYAGNRTSKKTHAYTTAQTPGTATSTQTYTYSTGAWGDQLSGTTYDAIGNPLTYNGWDMSWHGRQLMEISKNGGQVTYEFTYNADGIRTAKNVNGTVHTYALNGSQIVSESWGNHFILYLYDESGSPIGMQYRTASYAAGVFDTYFFEKNIFGDIIGVYTEAGVKIGSYTYDAWGNITTTVSAGNTSLQNTVVRNFNPFRYRGYFYDYETGLYYLQSRYYDPVTGRFINADGLVSTGTGLLGYNMYAYCNNNPVMCADSTGTAPICNCPSCMSGLEEECANYSPKSFSPSNRGKYSILYPSEEQKVLAADGIVRYKDTWVVKIPFMGNSSFSFGIIFMGPDADETLLRHEYGHFLHMKQIGPINYWEYVAKPSLELYWSGVPMEEYYNYPTEYIADMLAGVQRPRYDYWPNAREDAIQYYFYSFMSPSTNPFIDHHPCYLDRYYLGRNPRWDVYGGT